ncbi:MAG: RDAC family protein [Ruminococcus sp.]|jgi:hypothetical protein
MKIEYSDIVLINAELNKENTRYHVKYKDDNTACIEAPGECCITEERKGRTLKCIREYYKQKHISAQFSDDGLYYTCVPLE